MTAVAGAAYTAAQYNTNTRDNLLETGPAKATAAGRLLVTAGANSLVERVVRQGTNTDGGSTTSSSFTDLTGTTIGPTVTAVTSTMALIWFSAQMQCSAAGAVTQVALAISGATTRAADAEVDLYTDGLGASQAMRSSVVHLYDDLTAGSNTWTMKYRTGAGTGTFYDRSVGVMAL
ncbi:hypothetical protein BJF79_13875 [Actinomadura sp. CNU-125]|uniref:hypothetical protein n=1 Tax=Actinomadura sp. CNU-125 TaxID=1904961 RepID=UPI000969B5A9|nr:hypothetical protein [Actinomadura sp. CNU-125]OLT24426.1 hypothetical protein BJF79_13875 [Actinomadura sp. CNU-125]